ncbi:MAG: HEAT repeat domain-containing protein [Polyangiales bacterium]
MGAHDRDTDSVDDGAFSPSDGLNRTDSRIRPRAPSTVPADRISMRVPVSAIVARSTSLPRIAEYEWPSNTAPITQSAEEACNQIIARLAQSEPEQAVRLTDQLLSMSDVGVTSLAPYFPGKLWRPAEDVKALAIPARDISPIAYAISRFDARATNTMIELLGSPNRETRLYAAIVSKDLDNPKLVFALAAVALDDDADGRHAALFAMSQHRRALSFTEAMLRFQRVASESEFDEIQRKRAISALTQLRHEQSVPMLADLLFDSSPSIRKASRLALRILTGHDFGYERSVWLSWLREHSRKPRILWLISALGDHRIDLQHLASVELYKATSQFLPPDRESASIDAYRHLQSDYRTWWATEAQLRRS